MSDALMPTDLTPDALVEAVAARLDKVRDAGMDPDATARLVLAAILPAAGLTPRNTAEVAERMRVLGAQDEKGVAALLRALAGCADG